MQVLFLNINKDAEHDRLMAFVQAVRQHMQTKGVLQSQHISISYLACHACLMQS